MFSMASKQGAVTVSKITAAKEKFCGGQIVLSYRVEYPEFTASFCVQNLRLINNFYRQRADRLMYRVHQCLIPLAIDGYHDAVQNGNPVLPYEVVSEFTVTQNDGRLLSLYTDCYEFTGGAHGNTVRTSETWNIKKGCRLSLKETCSCADGRLNDRIKAEIKNQIGKNAENYFENYEELIDQTFNPSQFYVKDGQLVVYFQQYDIAPYSTGITEFVIPASVCTVSA